MILKKQISAISGKEVYKYVNFDNIESIIERKQDLYLGFKFISGDTMVSEIFNDEAEMQAKLIEIKDGLGSKVIIDV